MAGKLLMFYSNSIILKIIVSQDCNLDAHTGIWKRTKLNSTSFILKKLFQNSRAFKLQNS